MWWQIKIDPLRKEEKLRISFEGHSSPSIDKGTVVVYKDLNLVGSHKEDHILRYLL